MATRPYTSPIVEELRALGVMFATPPEDTSNMAGIIFDEDGEPTQIQNPAGELKDFPAAPPAPGAIPIPANNDDVDVILESAGGGQIQIHTTVDVDGSVGEINISPEAATATGPGAGVTVAGGPATDGDGGEVVVRAGNDFTSGATGAQVLASGATGGAGGALSLLVGAGSAPGALVLGARSGNLAVDADSDPVTIADLAPPAGAVSISKWIPMTLDGVDGFIPFFTVNP